MTDPAKEATCTESGLTEGSHCVFCGEILVAQTVIPAKGHTPGAAADCTHDQTCTVCNAILETKLGHNYRATVSAPTCTEQGYITHTCTRCGDSYADCYVDAKGHNYVDTVTSPTKAEDGYITHICSICGDTYKDVLPATGSDGLKYTINADAKTCTLIGIGDCTDTDIVIPLIHNGRLVTAIGDGAFENCTSLESIRIPDSVTSIGRDAFENCTSLTSITIPDSVTFIGCSAFFLCSSFESIVVVEGNPAYHSEGNCLIDTKAKTLIAGCQNSVIPADGSVTTIGNGSFWGCTGLRSITIPDSVTLIGYSAFYNCSGLESIVVSKGNPVYHSEGNCLIKTGTKTLIVGCQNSVIPTDGSVTSIGDKAFDGCTSLKGITIPDSVTSIGNAAFVGCTSLEDITILGNISSIGWCVFYDCKSLKSITIPGNVTSIGNGTFCNCTSLKSITISDSVTFIDEYAFYNCTSLTDVYFTGTMAQWEGITFALGNESLTSASIHCTDGDVGSEASLTPSEGLAYSLLDDGTYEVVGIGSCTDTCIVIPSTYEGKPVTAIRDYAFSGCTSLENITIPDGVTSIGDVAFAHCTSLESITIPDGVTSFGRGVFADCSSLESIVVSKGNPVYHSEGNCIIETETKTLIAGCQNSVIPADGSVTSIGDYAFYGCSSLKGITLPDSVTSIGISAFDACASLEGIKIPDGVTYIGDFAFSYCFSLKSITLPDSVISISNSVFYDCCSLEDITLPDSVTTIDDYAFYGCGSLKGIMIPNSVTSIGYMAFYECTSLTSVTIGNNVTSIGQEAFNYCESLTSVTIGNNVTSIGQEAFNYCESLTSITIPDSITSIGDGAFKNCTSLTDVYYSGTMAQWEQISIGLKNETLSSATIHCTDGDVN